MAKNHPVVTQVPQGLARHQSIDGSRRLPPDAQVLGLRERLFRKRRENPRTFPMAAVFQPIRGLPPLLGHLSLGARRRRVRRPIGKARETEQVPCDRPGGLFPF
jgi:hypothetical protein